MARINAAQNFAGAKYATQNFVSEQILKLSNTFNPAIETLQNAIIVDGTGADGTIGDVVYDLRQDYNGLFTGDKLSTSILPDLALTDVIVVPATSESDTIQGLIAANIPTNGVQQGDVFVITAETEAIASQVAGSYIMLQNVDKGSDVTGKYAKLYSQDGHVTSVGGATPVAGAVALKVKTDIGGDKSFANGSVTLSYSDFMTLSGDVLTVGDKSFSSKDVTDVYGTDISKLRAELGGEVDTTSDTFKSVYTRLTAIQASLGIGGDDGNQGVAQLLADEIAARKEDDAILKAAIQAQIVARKADDVILETAVNAQIADRKADDAILEAAINAQKTARIADDAVLETAVNAQIAARKAEYATLAAGVNSALLLSQEEASIVQADAETPASYTMTNAGLIFAVVDNTSKEQVYPTIIYNGENKAVLTADYEKAVTATWTIYYASNPALSEVATDVTASAVTNGETADVELTNNATAAAALANKEQPANTVELKNQQ